MRPKPNEHQRVTSAKTPPRGGKGRTGATGVVPTSPKSPAAAYHAKNGQQQHQPTPSPPVQVRIRNTAPPDPELLSKIGCRCLVIDFPGVLYENITVSYITGYIRVEGKRTVGRCKSFRKKFPINHDQVVTRMLSAFLCQGVLVIVAPTKVAAAMAAAAIVAAQLLAKGYSIHPGGRTNSKISPPPPFFHHVSERKMLTQYAAGTTTKTTTKPEEAQEEGSTRFPSDEFRAGTSKVAATTTNGRVIDFRKKSSAFTPYVSSKPSIPVEDVTSSTKSIPFDEELEPSPNTTSSSSDRPLKNESSRLPPKPPNNRHIAPPKVKLDDGVEEEKTEAEAEAEVEIIERIISISPLKPPQSRQEDSSFKQSPSQGTASTENSAAESYSSLEGTQEPEKRPAATVSSSQATYGHSKGIVADSTEEPTSANPMMQLPEEEQDEKPLALWSDDSLRDEPSVSATKSLRIMESLYVDSFRDITRVRQLSPILEHPNSTDTSYETAEQTSPNDNDNYDDDDNENNSNRPLAWVQFDSGWQEKEQSLMVDTASNHKRIEQLHHRGGRHHHQEGRKRAKGTNVKVGVPIMLPFEDEQSDEDHHRDAQSHRHRHHHQQWRQPPFLPTLLESNDPHSIDRYSVDARGYYTKDSFFFEEQGVDPPSWSHSPQRRTASSFPTGGRGKHVTWIDEFGEI